MKYSIQKEGDKFCVYDGDGNSKGTFDTRAEAMKEMKVLYAGGNTPAADAEGKAEPGDSAAEDKAEPAPKKKAKK